MAWTARVVGVAEMLLGRLANFLQFLHLLRIQLGFSRSRELFYQLGQFLIHTRNARGRDAR